MSKLYLANAFSLNMLGALPPEGLNLRVRPISLEEVKEILRSVSFTFTSAVGHESTARILTTLLGVEVPLNRVAISLSPSDKLIVFQIKMRLEEGRILSEEEVRSLYEQGLASFVLVEVQG